MCRFFFSSFWDERGSESSGLGVGGERAGDGLTPESCLCSGQRRHQQPRHGSAACQSLAALAIAFVFNFHFVHSQSIELTRLTLVPSGSVVEHGRRVCPAPPAPALRGSCDRFCQGRGEGASGLSPFWKNCPDGRSPGNWPRRLHVLALTREGFEGFLRTIYGVLGWNLPASFLRTQTNLL